MATPDFIAKSEDQNNGRRSANRERGRRGHAQGDAEGGLSREVQISKGLSKLLRHAAGDAGLKLDAEGFARVDRVVSLLLSLHCSLLRKQAQKTTLK